MARVWAKLAVAMALAAGALPASAQATEPGRPPGGDPAGAGPAPLDGLDLDYKLTVAGIGIATLDVLWQRPAADGPWAMRLDGKTVGPGRLWADWKVKVVSAGALRDGAVAPTGHHITRRLRKRTRVTDFIYGPDRALTPILTPPPKHDDGDIDPERLRGTVDLLSGLVEALTTMTRSGGCEHAVETFEGRRLYAFRFETLGSADPGRVPRAFRDNGPILSCAVHVERVVGAFKAGPGSGLGAVDSPEELREEDERPLKALLGPAVPGGPIVPLHIDLPSGFGLVDVRIKSARVRSTGPIQVPPPTQAASR